jgi:hypothetical protein
MSWHVAILPFVEQKPLYDRFDFNVTAYLGTVASAPANNVARYNAGNCREPIDLFFCPSGNVLNTQNTGENPSTGGTATSTHYYGVMGPKSPPSAGTPLTPKINGGNYPAASATGGAGHGGFATTGVLRKQVAHAVRDVTDGTSNTFVIGEISWNKANTYRIWLRGAEGSAHGAAKNIENPINKVPYNGSNNFNDVSFGSEHPGGAQFSLLDGKITFASENIDMGIYRALGSRAEGEPARAP